MRPALPDCFRQDPLNAFIPVLPELKAFSFRPSIPLWSLNRNTRSLEKFPRTKLKDQSMKKMFLTLALASSSLLHFASAATITQNFTADPAQNGWRLYGDTNLFSWSSSNHNLEVTWNSTHTNSFFYMPLGTILTRHDDFSFEFDLRLNDIVSGNEPGKTGPMQLAIGFQNFSGATSTHFKRGVYYPFNAPDGAVNLVEFDYFPAGYYDFGGIFPVDPTTQPVFISTNGSFAPTTLSPFVFELPTNQFVHVSMTYTASNQTVVTTITNSSFVKHLPDVSLNDSGNSLFTTNDNFHVDTFSISSYSSVGDDYDSILAHGVVDNLVITIPPPPIQSLAGSFTNSIWQAKFIGQTNWLYSLERTTDFQSWTNIAVLVNDSGTNLVLQDTNPPSSRGFYRVSAEKP